MIGYLRGTLIHKGLDSVLLDVQGVGYQAEVPLSTLSRLPEVGEPVALYIHTHVREDAIRLFGFESMEGLHLFEKLIGVSGVGPRIALSALSHLGPEELRRAIVESDVKQLSRIPGIGKRTAERVIVDLSEHLQTVQITGVSLPGPSPGTTSRLTRELEEALRYLGYRDKEIQHALRVVATQSNESNDVQELLKQALRVLG